jgi:hypothetical protein
MPAAIDPVIKKQVVKQWLSGDSRDRIAADNDIGLSMSEVKQLFPSDNGVNCVLELIGTVTLLDSIQAGALKGIICNTGILGMAARSASRKCFDNCTNDFAVNRAYTYKKPVTIYKICMKIRLNPEFSYV